MKRMSTPARSDPNCKFLKKVVKIMNGSTVPEYQPRKITVEFDENFSMSSDVESFYSETAFSIRVLRMLPYRDHFSGAKVFDMPVVPAVEKVLLEGNLKITLVDRGDLTRGEWSKLVSERVARSIKSNSLAKIEYDDNSVFIIITAFEFLESVVNCIPHAKITAS